MECIKQTIVICGCYYAATLPRGVCLYKCGNERYNLAVHAPEYKEKLFGSAGGR